MTATIESEESGYGVERIDGVVPLPAGQVPGGRSLREYMRLRASGIAYPLFTMRSHFGNGEPPVRIFAITAEQAEVKVKGQWHQGRVVELVSVTERARPEIIITDRQLHELADQTIGARLVAHEARL